MSGKNDCALRNMSSGAVVRLLGFRCFLVRASCFAKVAVSVGRESLHGVSPGNVGSDVFGTFATPTIKLSKMEKSKCWERSTLP